jgi:hypothetical protein
MATAEVTLDTVRITNNVFHGFAIALTALRLAERARQRKLGPDDAWAAAAMTGCLLFMVGLALHVEPSTALLSRTTRIGIYYFLAQGFYMAVWCCRLSILMSLKRISTPGLIQTLINYAYASFLLMWAVLFSQVFWVCEVDTAWKDTPAPQCVLGQNVAIAQVITDVCADLFLVAMPIHIFLRSKLSVAGKTRLIAVFSATLATTTASLIHAVVILRAPGVLEAFVAVIEDGVSLTVINIPVIVASFLRIFRKQTGQVSVPAPSAGSSGSYQMTNMFKTTKHGNTTIGIGSVGYDDSYSTAGKGAVLAPHENDSYAFSGVKPNEWSGEAKPVVSNGPGIHITREIHQSSFVPDV